MTMLIQDDTREAPYGGLPLLAAADLQDHLMVVSNDLQRLQTLLSDACDTLMQSFHGASATLDGLRAVPATNAATAHASAFDTARLQLGGAIVALQFQDMASQLIDHTHQRLRSCVDQLAREAFADDEDGEAIVEAAPLRPNPVTQDEMDAGSVELF